MTAGIPPTLPFGTRRESAHAARGIGRQPSRMRVLAVLSSAARAEADPLRSLLDAVDRLADRVEYAFAIDDRDPRAGEALVTFCEARGIDLHVGRHRDLPEAHDAANLDLPALLGRGDWDLIEVNGWSHAATHAAVLDAIGDAALAYTPHHEPPWTIPLTPAQWEHADAVHGRMLARADVVLCASPWERMAFQARNPDRHQCTFLPFGVDFEASPPGPLDRPPRLVFVGDPTASPAPFARALGVFGRLVADRPELRLTVAGGAVEGTATAIPDALRPSCDVAGRLDDGALRRALAESRCLILLPDVEAPGRLVVQALALGTPVYMNRLFPIESLFGRAPGVHLGKADDPNALAAMIGRGLDRGPAAMSDVLEGRARLVEEFDAPRLAERRRQAMATAWFYRTHWSRDASRPLARRSAAAGR